MDNKPIQYDGLAGRAQGQIMAGFIIFMIELIMIICTMLSDIGCQCGTSECFCGVGTMVTILIAIVPAIVSMILAGRGMAAKRQLGNRGTELPKYYGVLGIITEFQVPIIFVVALVWFLAFNGTSYAGR